jgi:hypothetical protein
MQVAQLRQLALVPTVSQQPLARLQRGHLLLHQGTHFGDAGSLTQVQVVELVHATIGEVPVRIDQPGSRCPAMQVDDPGLLRPHGQDVRVCTHTQDAAIADSDRLCNRIVRIDRQDPTMHQHHIGLRSPLSGSASRSRCRARSSAAMKKCRGSLSGA